jgi:hypothetical protein
MAVSAELQALFDKVKVQTGYPVSVIPDPAISTHSAMNSATPERASHVIRVNPKYDRYGNALVAQQAAMLLIKWADPNKVPDFGILPGKAEALRMKFLPRMKSQGFDPAVAEKYITILVEGLLQQLNSIPCQIMAMEMCWDLCPGLRDEITLSANAEVKEASATLNPKIKETTPSEIYRRSVTMNAAYAKKWSEKCEDRLPVLPYEATEFMRKASELCAAIDSIPREAPDRYPRAVDSWAKVLEMEGWYQFVYRKA